MKESISSKNRNAKSITIRLSKRLYTPLKPCCSQLAFSALLPRRQERETKVEEKHLVGIYMRDIGREFGRALRSFPFPSHGFVAARSPLWGYRANRVPLSHANSPATAVIASRRGLTSNTSWLVFLSTVGVSPLLLAPPPPPFFHQSLVLHLESSLFNSFPSSLFLAHRPTITCLCFYVCLTVSSPFHLFAPRSFESASPSVLRVSGR